MQQKTRRFLGLFIIVLLFNASVGVYAQDPYPANNSIVEQVGPNNILNLDQTDWGNNATIKQETEGPLNTSTIKQHSPFNSATLKQIHNNSGEAQESYIEQIGDGNNSAQQIQGLSELDYQGAENYLQIIQNGGNNTANQKQIYRSKNSIANQSGHRNSANQEQTSENGSIANIIQDGNDNIAEQIQMGLSQICPNSLLLKNNRRTPLFEGIQHSSKSDQTGNNNITEQHQSGITHLSLLNNIESADVHIRNFGHAAEVRQVGERNTIVQTQQGLENIYATFSEPDIANNEQTFNGAINIVGFGHVAFILQEGRDNNASQVQKGFNELNLSVNYNEAYWSQNGQDQIDIIRNFSHNAHISQQGDNNVASQTQTGENNLTVCFDSYIATLRIFAHIASVDQIGNLNSTTQDQHGTNHFAQTNQLGDSNIATQRQNGTSHYAFIQQKGDGNTANQIQEGHSNRAIIEQQGDNNSVTINQTSL